MPRIDVPFIVNGQTIEQRPKVKIAAGGQNYFYAIFKTCDIWNEIDYKKAVFRCGDDQYIVDLVPGNEYMECKIPWEIMQNPGFFDTGIFGGSKLPTDLARTFVIEGCVGDGKDPQPPTPDWFDNMEARMDNYIVCPAKASIGQIIAVKSIDESGKPIEWKLVDMSGNTSMWIDLGTFDNVIAEMDNLLEDGRYRLWSDDPFCYSLEVERVGDTIGQTHWSSEEGVGHQYFRTGIFNDGEVEWLDEWTSHVTQDWLNQYALKTHKHRQTINADFDTWINTFREGQYQIHVQAETKSYIVDQFVFNNKPISTIHVCQRYFEISEPWIVYARHGTTNGNYVLVNWDEWHVTGDDN